jgi:hypothetical protein
LKTSLWKRHSALAVLLLVFLAAIAPPACGKEKNKADAGRLLTGKVVDKRDNPLPDSVVYLSNTRTRAVKSYIVGPDGQFHFPELSPNIDYEVYAQYKDLKSDTKTVSQFDDRKAVNLNLRIDTK